MVYLSFRPYVFFFLEEMSKYYEIILFTASQSSYVSRLPAEA